MNSTTIPKITYQRGRTLGRSGYDQDVESKLLATVSRLDALLCVISSSDFDGDDGNDFQRMNVHIQAEVLGLASELAYEAHEMVTQIHVYRGGTPGRTTS